MTWGKPKSTVRMRCIAYECRCTVDKALHPYADEVVCQKCWKTVPSHLKDTYRQFRRTERRYRKWENQGNIVTEGTWRWIAREQALNWAKIREFVTAKPEFPAGLTGFLQELGFER